MFNLLKKSLRLKKIGTQVLKVTRYSTISQNTAPHKCSDSQLQTRYGQPTPLTHPHLLGSDELIPGLKLHEFKDRRRKLAKHIVTEECVEKPVKAPQIVIIPSSSKVYMSGKIPYVFRQNTDFLYFTGCKEPDSILLLSIKEEDFESTLFVQKKDSRSELWDGPRTGSEAAREMFGVDRSLPVTEFEVFLSSLLNEYKTTAVWYDKNEIINPEVHQIILKFINTAGPRTFHSPQRIFHNIRLIKSEAEIQLMHKSCKIASASIAKTIELSHPGMSEHQLFATVDYECRMNGAEFLAYPPVVAGGKNANIIHYITNNQIINSQEMVLMDAGCEYHGYTSDITRTWPIDGSFTSFQRELYEVVLDVQKILIKQLEDLPTLDRVYFEMCKLLGKRLQEIGLIPKSLSGQQLAGVVYMYCPHHVSHYLGMDVHDTGKISRNIQTQPGMIVTVEPGVYVSPTNEFAPPEFHNLGIRIEDDVLIRESGPLVLTESCPKEIIDIESLAKRNQDNL